MRHSLFALLLFFISLTAFSQGPELTFPKNGQTLNGVQIFSWNKDTDVMLYRVRIGRDATLSDVLIDTENNRVAIDLDTLPLGILYWEVITYKFFSPFDTSAMGSFRNFNPKAIDSLNLWLRADTGLTMNGNKVQSWQDLSDSLLFINQTFTSRQPILVDSALNNYPVLRFDSTDDEMRIPIVLEGSNYSISAVYNLRENKNRTIRLFDGSNNWLIGPFGSTYRTYNGAYTLGKPVIQYQYLLQTGYVADDTLHNYINGVYYDENRESYPAGNVLWISHNGLNGDLAEVVIVNGTMQDSVREQIDQYLMDKYAPPVNLGNDTIICSFPVSISNELDYALQYNWSNGDTTASTVIDSAGLYYLTITDQFERISVDSMNFILDTVNYQANFGFADTIICKGDEFVFNAGEERYSYQWSTGDTTNVVRFDSAAIYTLSLTNCLNITSVDSFELILNQPVFSLGPDTVVCYDVPYTLQSDSNFTNVSYSWSNGSSNPTIIPDSTKSYQLKVTDTYGCSFIDSAHVTMDSSLYGLSLGPDTSLCEGNYLQLTGDTSFITSYQWGSGNTSSRELIDTAGTYTLVVNSSRCSFSDAAIISIKGLAPIADFSSNFYCFGDSVSFLSQSSAPANDSLVAYNWDFNSLGSSIDKDPFYVFPDTGIQTVVLRVTTDKGCEDSRSRMIDIQSLPKPDFNYIGSCSKRPIQFNSSSTIDEGSIVAYLWDFSNGLRSTLENPIANFDTLGSYPVKLIATSDQACVDSVEYTLAINPSAVLSFAVSNQCFGDSTLLQSTLDLASGSVANYDWFTNNQQISDSIAKIKYLNQGKQQVILRVTTDQNCQTILRDSVEIYEQPIADFTVENICEGTNFQAVDQSISVQDQITSHRYIISMGSYSDTSNSTDPSLIPNGLGDHMINLKITTNNGCSDSIAKNARVNANPIANFSIVNDGSGAPYTLEVVNSSSGAEQYNWESGNGSTSSMEEPSFVYADSGSYQLRLVAISDSSCTDTITKDLRVLPYFLDASIEDAQLIKDLDGSYKIRMRFANNGNNKIDKMVLRIEAENQFSLGEAVNKDLYKGSSLVHTLSTFLPASGNNASFICFTLESVNGVKDDVNTNDQLCISALPNKLYLSAYPNPVQEWLTVDFVLLNAGKLSLNLYDSKGNLVNNQINDQFLDEGYHQKKLNLFGLKSGLYILRFSFEGFEEEMKIVKH